MQPIENRNAGRFRRSPRLWAGIAAAALTAAGWAALGCVAWRQDPRQTGAWQAAVARSIARESGCRIVRLPDVRNCRDIGGWRGRDGRAVRYGMIFRSGELDHVQRRDRTPSFVLGEESRRILADGLGIRTDLDLRSDEECAGMEASPLGSGVVWRHIPGAAYGRVFERAGRENFARLFRVLLDPAAYPVLIHCRAGRDRAGTAVALLNALLGVDEQDLRLDWELSERLAGNLRYDYRRIDGLFAALARFPGADATERTEAFLRSMGFCQADFERFRALMLQKE